MFPSHDQGGSKVLACELNEDLAHIAKAKCDEFLCNDFFQLTAADISHIHAIVMNPPFHNAEKHILHAWEIAPEGCEITSLANWNTLDKSPGWGRSEVRELVTTYGNIYNLGNCFSDGERRTDIEVGMCKIYKPMISAGTEFEGFYMEDDEYTTDQGLIPNSEVQRIVTGKQLPRL